MLRLVARRAAAMVPILLGVVITTMLLLELMPGDPAAIMAGERATPEAIEHIRRELDLDKAFVARVIEYVGGVLQGDLGRSPTTGLPVSELISGTLPVTLSLGGAALLLSLLLGVTFGTLAGLRRGRIADRIVTGLASLAQAIPPFVVGLGLIVLFAVSISVMPAGGFVPLSESPANWLRHIVLPATALALIPAAEIARQTRGALVDTLEQDFIRTCRAKGLSERSVIGKHAAKNAAPPVVTVFGLQVARVLGGAVVIELVFGMHGFGQLALQAVLSRNVALIRGIVLVSAVVVMVANLLVDISYGYFTPRSRT